MKYIKQQQHKSVCCAANMNKHLMTIKSRIHNIPDVVMTVEGSLGRGVMN